MYNEELKRQFIRSYTQSLKTAEVARSLFDAFEPYEKEWQSDVCTRTADELQPIFDKVLWLRSNSKRMGVTIIKEYAKWCMLSNYPGACDGISSVNIMGLDKIRTQMVVNPLSLQQYLDKVFDAESKETIDNVYRCFLWMVYGGLSKEEALSVRNRDVDFKTLRITAGETTATIYREALPAFLASVNLDSFTWKHSLYINKDRSDRIPGDLILRGIKKDAQLDTMRSTLSKRMVAAEKAGVVNMTLTFYRLYLSGLFYRTYEMELAGSSVDFSEAAAKDMDGKEYSLKGRDSLRIKFNRKVRDYKTDYQLWKLAFSI